MTTTPLVIFTDAFVTSLRIAIGLNLPKYQKDDAWAGYLLDAKAKDLITPLSLRQPISLTLPLDDERRGSEDGANAIRLHQALPKLTPLQARDPRLWTRLTHIDLWAYMRKRWPIERWQKDGEQTTLSGIRSRYFVAQSQSRALLRNGAARLWWTAEVSHDPDRENPYELTPVLFYTLDITQTLLERNMGRSRDIVASFLEFIKRNEKELVQEGDKSRLRVRSLAKSLNLTGGVCLLDSLSRNDITDMLTREFDRLMAKETPEVAAA